MAVLIVWKTLLLVVVVAAVSFWFGGWYFGHFGPIATYRIQVVGQDNLGVSYSELAAIMLGAVAVLVAIIGIGVAVLAVWGYGQLNQQARRAATKHVKDQLREGNLKKEIEQMILKHVEHQIKIESPLRTLISQQVSRIIHTDAELRQKKEDQINENSEYGD